MNITDILRQLQEGDRQAFAAVVQQYQRPLFGFLGRLGLSQSRAEELAQETFLRAWRNLGQYNPQLAAFSTWLFTIARNLALNELSRAVNEWEVVMQDDLPELACARPQPPEALAQVQQRRRLHTALQQLPLAERCAVALAYIGDFELVEIARIEGCTIGTIKTRLHRARRRLFDLLEKDHE